MELAFAKVISEALFFLMSFFFSSTLQPIICDWFDYIIHHIWLKVNTFLITCGIIFTKYGLEQNMKYSERLKSLREDSDLTQSDIAKVLNTTYQYYSTYEAGKREMPFSRAIELARYYNVSLDYLAGLIDTPRKLN